ADLRRMPIDARVACEHRLPNRRRADEPRGARVVQQRRAAAPTMRVRVRDAPRLPQYAATVQLLDQTRIGILEVLPAAEGHGRRESAGGVDRLQEREIVARSRRVVVLAECGRHVYDT